MEYLILKFLDNCIKMKTLYRSVVAALLVFLCASCNKEQIGSPYMLFEVHGKVTDSENNPLPGILVSSGLADVQKTNVNGLFAIYGRTAPSSMITLSFEDSDGDDNGGEFSRMSKQILLNEKTPGNPSGNYRGTYFAGGVEVIMIEKKGQMNQDSLFNDLRVFVQEEGR